MVPHRLSITLFLDWLRNGQAGFEASDQQYLAAQTLIEAAVMSDCRVAPSVTEWKTLLAPVLCSSQAQQSEFYELFTEWFERAQAIPSQVIPDEKKSEKRIAARDRWLYILSFLALSLVAVWAVHYVLPKPSPNLAVRSKKGQPRPAATPETSDVVQMRVESHTGPVPNVSFQHHGKSGLVDNGGQLSLPRYPKSDFVMITAPNMEPYVASYPQSDGVANMVTAQPVRLPNPVDEFLGVHRHMIRIASVSLPLILLSLWLIQQWRRWLELRRWNSIPQPKMSRFGNSQQLQALFRGSDIRRIATALRRRRPEISSELDPTSTVEQTCREAGFFKPVYARWTSEPEYLFIGGRKNMSDQQARYQDELISHLRGQDISIQRYYFHTDPSNCSDQEGVVYSLTELSVMHPTHELWLAAEPSECVDPVSGELKPWCSALENWNERTLFAYSSAPPLPGIPAVEPTRHGLEQLVGLTDKQLNVTPFPPLIRSAEDWWVQRAEPIEAQTPRLDTQLEMYLGEDGYLLLQSCAVYPALAWNITRTLAEDLVAATKCEDVLAKLAALPWFRHGIMPDWMRIRLLRQLGANEDKVRTALRRYLDKAIVQTLGRHETLDIVPGRPPAKLRGTALEDTVFLSFVSKQRLDKLSLKAPEKWRKLLRDSLSLRIGIAVISVLLFWVFLGKLMTDVRARLAVHPGPIVKVSQPQDQYVKDLYTVARSIEARPDLNAAKSTQPDLLLYSAIASNLSAVQNPMPDLTAARTNMRAVPTRDAAPGMVVLIAGRPQMIEAVASERARIFQTGWTNFNELGTVYELSQPILVASDSANPHSVEQPGHSPVSHVHMNNATSGNATITDRSAPPATIVSNDSAESLASVTVSSPQAFQTAQRELQDGVAGFRFGANYTTINALLDPPFPDNGYQGLQVAEEFPSKEVRYMWRRLADLRSDPAFAQYFSLLQPFAECFQSTNESYVVFLFQDNKLIRVSSRFFDDCPTRPELFEKFVNSLGLSLKMPSNTTDVTIDNIGAASILWKPGSSGDLLDIYNTGSPQPLDNYDPSLPLPLSKNICTLYGEAASGSQAWNKDETCLIPDVDYLDQSFRQTDFNCCGGGANAKLTPKDIPTGIEVQVQGAYYWAVSSVALNKNKLSIHTYCGPGGPPQPGCNVRVTVIAHYKYR